MGAHCAVLRRVYQSPSRVFHYCKHLIAPQRLIAVKWQIGPLSTSFTKVPEWSTSFVNLKICNQGATNTWRLKSYHNTCATKTSLHSPKSFTVNIIEEAFLYSERRSSFREKFSEVKGVKISIKMGWGFVS